MHTAFLGEVFLFGGTRQFAQRDFLRCEGQPVPGDAVGLRNLLGSVGQQRVVDLRAVGLKGLSPGSAYLVGAGVYPSK